jgi:putative hydroxymethylpyrimidine transport system substrate-binding protein
VRLGHLILILAVAGALGAGCGSGGGKSASADTHSLPPAKLKEVSVSLDGRANAANVAILMAIQRGFFADVGLEVWAGAPVVPDRPVSYVTSGSVDFGVTQQPQVPIAKDDGARIVAIGSLVSQPTGALIWLAKSKIHGIADLEGKTIAISGIPYEEDLLESVLQRAGLTLEDVKLKEAPYELVPALLRGRADAIFGGSWNLEGVMLEGRGAKPVIRRVQDLGVPAYEELVLIARSDRVEKEPGMVRDFISAVARGAAAAVKDPGGAAGVIQESNERDLEATPKITRAQVKATLPLLSLTSHMDASQASELVNWMHEQGSIRSEPPASELFTDDYLEQP